MRALVYHGPGRKALEEAPDPEITDDADTRLEAAKHCGADVVVNNSREDPLTAVKDLAGGRIANRPGGHLLSRPKE